MSAPGIAVPGRAPRGLAQATLFEPKAQLRAAVLFAPLVARGLVAPAEALASLCAAARQAAPGWDAAGRRMRLAHALGDAVDACHAARARAADAARAAIAPLVAAWAPAPRILAAAAEAGTGLAPAEIVALVEAALWRGIVRRRGPGRFR